VSQKSWSIEFERAAEKDLARLDPPIRTRVLAALDRIITDPAHATGVSKLRGRPESKLRVGDWRVILATDRERRKILVSRILPRGRVYDR
jgi:mRNA interferase RelE/StbE